MQNYKKSIIGLIKKGVKLFLSISILFGLFFGLNNYNFVQAQTSEQQNTDLSNSTLDESLQKTKAILDVILKIIYMISWPLLFIAGKAMDNSLVYGEIFHLDAPLRKFWNIMKNFANYALGFILLYHILKSLFNPAKGMGSLKDPKTPLGIIKNTLIAGILIQSSRFLLAAVIDISTLATYAIGGMPLTILKNSNIGDQKVLGINTTFNIGESKSIDKSLEKDIIIYRTYGDSPKYKIANCRVGNGENSKYIIGKEINFIQQESTTGTQKLQDGMCVLGGTLYRFNEIQELNQQTDNSNYQKKLDEIISTNPTLIGFPECGYVIPIFGQNEYDQNNTCLSNPLSQEDFGAKGGEKRLESIPGTTISTLIDKSKGFVGPLVTIYSNTLNFSNMIQTDSGGDGFTFGLVLKFMLKAFFGIMLILPILALAIIMIARIGIIRMTIAFIPMLIIDRVFDLKIFEKVKALEINNLIRIIFAPVFIVFALSISLIFMTALNDTLSKSDNLEGRSIYKEKENSYSVLGIWTFRTNLDIGGGKDNISYLFINIFGIAIVWSLLFRAIKQTGNIGEAIGGKIKDIGQNFAGNIPIVPIAGGVGVNQIIGSGSGGSILDKMGDRVTTQMASTNKDKLAETFPGLYPEGSRRKKEEEETNTAAANAATINQTQATKIIEEVQKIQTEDTNARNDEIQRIIKAQTGQEINGSITDRIQQPENIKLLYQEFEKQNPGGFQKENFEKTFNIRFETIQPIQDQLIDYQTNLSSIDNFISDINNKRFEALLLISNQNREIEISGYKYKIKYDQQNKKYIQDNTTNTTTT